MPSVLSPAQTLPPAAAIPVGWPPISVAVTFPVCRVDAGDGPAAVVGHPGGAAGEGDVVGRPTDLERRLDGPVGRVDPGDLVAAVVLHPDRPGPEGQPAGRAPVAIGVTHLTRGGVDPDQRVVAVEAHPHPARGAQDPARLVARPRSAARRTPGRRLPRGRSLPRCSQPRSRPSRRRPTVAVTAARDGSTQGQHDPGSTPEAAGLDGAWPPFTTNLKFFVKRPEPARCGLVT